MDTEHSPQPKTTLTKGSHFGLSLLAVIVGVPISFAVTAVFGTFLMIFMIAALVGDSSTVPASGPMPFTYTYKYGRQGSFNRFVSVPIYGPIVSQSSASDPLLTIFGGQFTDGEKLKEQLVAMAHDRHVKGIILEIDSPGGQITASKALSDGISYVRSKNKPIIAHINGLGASGAYWAASSSDYIMAEQGSMSGSIGVILGDLPHYRDIIGLGEVMSSSSIPVKTFSAGKSKDIGNPFRDVTPEEVNALNGMLNREYDIFVKHVSATREITEPTIRDTIGALPYDSQKALEHKLIDRIDSKEEAYIELAQRANVPTDDFVIEEIENDYGFWGSFFGATAKRLGFRAEQPQVNTEARARFCASFVRSPLVIHGSGRTYCS